MKTVYKYDIPITDYFSLDLPANSRILSVQVQRDIPCIWVEIDTEETQCRTDFRLVGTGHNLKEDNLLYIGTFQLFNGMLVYHLYEVL